MDSRSELVHPFRVLDLTRSVAGPWTTKMLADAGLDVIKLEPVPAGDFVRHLPARIDEFNSGYFRQCNAGKKSIAIDLKSTEGRQLFWRLVPQVDVVMHNMRPNAAKRLGIVADEVHRVNPDAVFVQVSGYGSETSFVRRPGQDLAVQCVTGIAELTGTPGAAGNPSLPVWSLIDTLTSAYAYVAICSALLARAKRGEQCIAIEIVMSQCCALLHDVAPFLWARKGIEVSRSGRYHPYLVLRGVTRCTNGWIAVSAFRRRHWRRIAPLVDSAFDPGMTTHERWLHRQEIQDAADRVFANVSVADALDRLYEIGVPAQEVKQSLEDVEASGLFQQREMLVKTADGGVFAAGMLNRARSKQHLLGGGPRYGGHTYEVLTELAGLNGEALMRLLGEGVIGCEPSVLGELVTRCLPGESTVVA